MTEANTILAELNLLTAHPRYSDVIAAVVLKDIYNAFEEPARRGKRKFLNLNEVAFLTGLWIKNTNYSISAPFDAVASINKTFQLMQALHDAILATAPGPEEGAGKSTSEFMTHETFFKEAFFYASQGATDLQFCNNAPEKYSHDYAWFMEHKKFSPETMAGYYWHLRTSQLKKINGLKRKSRLISQGADFTGFFTLTEQEVNGGSAAYRAITNAFSIEPGKDNYTGFTNVGDFNAFQVRPIVRLQDGRLFIPLLFFVAEAMYESPFYWMNEDRVYMPTALKHRGEVAEEMVYARLAAVFGASHTFRNIQLIAKKGQAATDIDVCVLHQNRLVIFQVKSKRLTALSKKGDVETVKADFNKAVEAAFVQGITSKNYLTAASSCSFVNEQGERVDSIFSGVESVHIVCVVLDVFPALTLTTPTLLYDKYQEPTICLSVFDLEAVCTMLGEADRLMDYLLKRIEHCKYYYAENERAILGFYLRNDIKIHPGYDMAAIEQDYGNKINDALYARNVDRLARRHDWQCSLNDPCPCGSGKKYKRCHGKQN